MNTSSIERLVETQLLDEQIAYCQRNQIQLTPNFKSMLHNVTYSLLGQNNLLFYGDPVSNKTTLWKTATACFDFEIAVVSNLALEPSGDGKYEMKHIKILEKDHNEPVKDLLLVLEGDLDKTIDSTLLALLQYDTFLLKDTPPPLSSTATTLFYLQQTPTTTTLATRSTTDQFGTHIQIILIFIFHT